MISGMTSLRRIKNRIGTSPVAGKALERKRSGYTKAGRAKGACSVVISEPLHFEEKD